MSRESAMVIITFKLRITSCKGLMVEVSSDNQALLQSKLIGIDTEGDIARKDGKFSME